MSLYCIYTPTCTSEDNVQTWSSNFKRQGQEAANKEKEKNINRIFPSSCLINDKNIIKAKKRETKRRTVCIYIYCTAIAFQDRFHFPSVYTALRTKGLSKSAYTYIPRVSSTHLIRIVALLVAAAACFVLVLYRQCFVSSSANEPFWSSILKANSLDSAMRR